MNSGKALDNDGPAPKMSGLQSSMFSAGSLTVVLISHHNPWNSIFLHISKDSTEV